MNNNFSENLKTIRKENNLSQEQLAEKLNVSRQAISKWESSVAYPEMDKIIFIANMFNYNIDDLLNKNINEIKSEDEGKGKINKYTDDFLSFITKTVNLFSDMSFKSKIKCLFEQVIIIFVLFVMSLAIITFFKSFLFDIFNIMPSVLNTYMRNISEFILLLFCTALSLIVLVNTFKTRYLDYYEHFNNNLKDCNIDDELDKENKIELKRNENKIIIRDSKQSEYGFIKLLIKFVVFGLKFFALIFSLFLCFVLVFLLSSFVLSFLLYKTGLFFLGLLISTISASFIDITILLMLFNFIFNRKSNKKKMIYSFIISLIFFGIGIGLIISGSLKFDIVEDYSAILKTNVEEFNMNEDTLINVWQDDIEFVESNIENIKIEYKVNKYCKTKSNISNDSIIHIWSYCDNPLKLMRETIKDINNKKIIPLNDELYDVKVYASKENINILKNNREKYFKS